MIASWMQPKCMYFLTLEWSSVFSWVSTGHRLAEIIKGRNWVLQGVGRLFIKTELWCRTFSISAWNIYKAAWKESPNSGKKTSTFTSWKEPKKKKKAGPDFCLGHAHTSLLLLPDHLCDKCNKFPVKGVIYLKSPGLFCLVLSL